MVFYVDDGLSSTNSKARIMHQIHKLKDANTVNGQADPQGISFACQALEVLISRLYDDPLQIWLERVTITRIWMTTFEPLSLDSATTLSDLLNRIYNNTGRPFGPEATHAAQSLVWKRIDNTHSVQGTGIPDLWCGIAGHLLFQRAGDLNKAKIQRKMIMNALTKGDIATARQAYFQMPESEQAAPITKYIMYKVALQSGDADLASESLQAIVKEASKDSTFLYACALEAHQHGDRAQVLAVLQKVLEQCNHEAPKSIHLPILVRTTAKLIMTEMRSNNTQRDVALLELCKIFEVAMSQAKHFRDAGNDGANTRYQAELRWFANYSYNLALEHLAEIQPEVMVRLMTICISFVNLLCSETAENNELARRLLLCRFLATSALVVLGRSEDNIEHSLSFYLDARRQVEAFQKTYKDVELTQLESSAQVDLASKDFELLKYDLEALLKLQHWSDLDRVLEVGRRRMRVLDYTLILQ